METLLKALEQVRVLNKDVRTPNYNYEEMTTKVTEFVRQVIEINEQKEKEVMKDLTIKHLLSKINKELVELSRYIHRHNLVLALSYRPLDTKDEELIRLSEELVKIDKKLD